MTVGDAAAPEVAGNAELALAADFGALPRELLGIAGIVDEIFPLQAVDHSFDEIFISGTADERFFHFIDGVRSAHEDFDGGFVEGGLGVDGARAKHEGRIEVIM